MIVRKTKPVILDALQKYPAIAILGPRQCGKTTLAKEIGKQYFDLEKAGDQANLEMQWNELSKELIVLDEAQEMPDVFKKLRSAIDEDRSKNGKFLILGSIAPHLMKSVSQSLAGRVAYIFLTPFTLSEANYDYKKLWVVGGFPDGGILYNNYPKWQKNYLLALSSIDYPSWGFPAKPVQTNRLFSMLAHYNGQIFNAFQIAKSLGLSHTTINTYIEFLEGSFLIYRLQPFFSNLKKRLVKSPKIYFRDSGLLHALLEIEDYEDLLCRPWMGSSWEGFAIQQILSALQQKDIRHEAYFFRTSDGYEVDLVLKMKNTIWAIEIKAASEPTTDAIKVLEKCSEFINATKKIIITQTQCPVFSRNFISCSLVDFIKSIEDNSLF